MLVSGSSPGPLGDTDLRGTVSVWREGRACARVVNGPRAQAIAESFVLSSFCLLPPQTGGELLPALGPHCNTKATYSCLSN